LKMLGKKVEKWMDPKIFIHHLMQSTEVMLNHGNPKKTNEGAFWEDFSLKIPCEREKLMKIFDEFYAVDFPALSRICEGNNCSGEILKLAFQKGYEVVIATNPIFPKVAVLERLRWIDAEDFPFQLITTYENMHYAKPYKEYYLEIMVKIGREPHECMMIGNDVEEDMVAAELGLETYLVTDFLINRRDLDIKGYKQGTLDELKKYIQHYL
jgi:FMN phosphatase YigB (HAD superfamily)